MSGAGARRGPGAPAFGVYVHVPFCAARCDYCAFATWTDRDHLMERYVAACVLEIQRAVGEGGLVCATSVFLGGGTPSRLHPELVCRLLEAIPRAEGAEVTLECNPEDADAARLGAYRRAGVTRASFGIQSTHDHVLASLGRRASPAAAERASGAAAAAGFASWNLDLVFGAATESDADWAATLGSVLGLAHPPPHVSAYALTVEPGTPLARQPARHPDPDAQARRYERAEQMLAAAGYRWEEISNWARPGHECRHNHLYWTQGDYVGIGSAAHSHRAGVRWWNVRTPERYIAALEGGCRAEAGREVLTEAQQAFEARVLALRTPRGIPWASLEDPGALEALGLVTRRSGDADADADGDGAGAAGDRAVLTVRGRLLANEVSARIRSGILLR